MNEFSVQYNKKAAEAKETQVNKILSSTTKTCKEKFDKLVSLGYYKNDKENSNYTKMLLKQCGDVKLVDITLYDIIQVPGDGDCMFHAIVSAAKCAGTPLKDEGEEIKDGAGLRSYLLNYLETGNLGRINDIFAANSETLLVPESIERLKKGKNSTPEGWGTFLEMAMIAKLFGLTISIVNKDTSKITNGVDLAEKGIILLWTGNHYNWLRPSLKKIKEMLRQEFSKLRTEEEVKKLYEQKLKELKAKQEICGWKNEELENALATVKNEKMQKITEAAEDFKADAKATAEEQEKINKQKAAREKIVQLIQNATTLDQLFNLSENQVFKNWKEYRKKLPKEKRTALKDSINKLIQSAKIKICNERLKEDTTAVTNLKDGMNKSTEKDKAIFAKMFREKVNEIQEQIAKDTTNCKENQSNFDTLKQDLEKKYNERLKEIEAEEGAEQEAEQEVDKTVKYIIDTFSGGKNGFISNSDEVNKTVALDQLILNGKVFKDIPEKTRKTPSRDLKKKAALRIINAAGATGANGQSTGLSGSDIEIFLYGFYSWLSNRTYGGATGTTKPEGIKVPQMREKIKELIDPDQKLTSSNDDDNNVTSTIEAIDADDAETKTGEEQQRKDVDLKALKEKEALKFLEKYIDNDKNRTLSTPNDKVIRLQWFDKKTGEDYYDATLYYKLLNDEVVHLVIACVEGPPDIIGKNVKKDTTMELIEIQNYNKTKAGSIKPFVARVLRERTYSKVKTVFLSPADKNLQIGLYQEKWKMKSVETTGKDLWMKADKQELIKTLEKTNDKEKEDNGSKTGDTIEQSAQESKDDQATKVDANTETGTNVLFEGKMYNLRRLNIKKDSWILNKGNTETQALNGKAKKFDELTLANNKTLVETTDQSVQESNKTGDDLDKLNITKLRKMAQKLKVKNYRTYKKEDKKQLITAIKKALVQKQKFEKGEMNFQELLNYAIDLRLKAKGSKLKKKEDEEHFANKIAQHFGIDVPKKYKKLFDLHSIWDDQEDLMVPLPSSFGLADRKAREFMVFE